MSNTPAARGNSRLGKARRIVIKVGSALLVERASGRLNRAWLESLATDIAALRARGQDPRVRSPWGDASSTSRLAS